ncbi:MAG: hypothetical protein ACI4PF_01470 [Christensenellales bacterium]
MNNLEGLLNLFSQVQSKKDEPPKQEIPKEILDQYPYGDFPIRYTKAGQECLRKESENRFSYKEQSNNDNQQNSDNNLNLLELLPLLQLLSGKKEPQDIFKILSKILFKDNKELQTLFNLLPNNNIKSQELDNTSSFPDTNKVNISSLRRIN